MPTLADTNSQPADKAEVHNLIVLPLRAADERLLHRARAYCRFHDGSFWGRLGPRHPDDPWTRYPSSPLAALLAVRELWEGDAKLRAEDAVQAVAMMYAFPETEAPEPRGEE